MFVRNKTMQMSRKGERSNAFKENPNDQPESANTSVKDMGIAFGALIKNARDGSSHDRLSGNTGANRLEDNGGDDFILGRMGEDLLIGGRGNDNRRAHHHAADHPGGHPRSAGSPARRDLNGPAR